MDDFKDYLEELADGKRSATIKFRAVDGAVSIIRGHVVRVKEVSGRVMIETDSGLLIGANQILDINGRAGVRDC